MNPLAALTDTEAVRLYPELRPLTWIRDAGWRFLPVEVDDQGPTQLDAARVWPGGWRDAIRVRSATDALGLRMQVENREITWERTGTLAEVVEALLVLPVPGTRLAPHLAIGAAPLLPRL